MTETGILTDRTLNGEGFCQKLAEMYKNRKLKAQEAAPKNIKVGKRRYFNFPLLGKTSRWHSSDRSIH
jgi:predicted alpha/beta hydrolase